MNLLLVEDDISLSQGIAMALEREGFLVAKAFNGKQALEACANQLPDIVILDLGLPDIDGVEVLETIRKKYQLLPVIILTARSNLEDKVKALDEGADDYLAKPFDMPELLARLRVISRRLGTSNTSSISIDQVTLDLAAHTVLNNNEPVNLSRREYTVLKSLMENAGRVQTKESLEQKLYGYGDDVSSNTVEVHISHLRKKLPRDLIKTIRGVGYTIKKPLKD